MRKLVTLLNKIGRYPKDRESRKDVGIGEMHIVEFARCTHRLLRIMCNASANLDYAPIVEHQYEDFVDALFQLSPFEPMTANRREPLSELALRQKSVNYHLVLHHAQLAAVVQLQLEMALRCRPLSLFDDKGRRAMFESFVSHPLILLANVDDALRKNRQTFLEECITAIGGRETTDANVRSLAIDLAREWQLDVDRMRVLEIRLLYQQVCIQVFI